MKKVYQTQGTCSKFIEFDVEDGIVNDVVFYGGCNGNLSGIRQLIKGMTVDEVIERLGGIHCGPKPTSCPDQLATCLLEYKQKKLAQAK